MLSGGKRTKKAWVNNGPLARNITHRQQENNHVVQILCSEKRVFCTFVSPLPLYRIRKEQTRPSWPKRTFRTGGKEGSPVQGPGPWGSWGHRGKRGGRDMWWLSLSHASFGRLEMGPICVLLCAINCQKHLRQMGRLRKCQSANVSCSFSHQADLVT